jgi:hypothetical protein
VLPMMQMWSPFSSLNGGSGANEFAKLRGVAIEHDDYFFSSFRHDQWMKIRESDEYKLDHSAKCGIIRTINYLNQSSCYAIWIQKTVENSDITDGGVCHSI